MKRTLLCLSAIVCVLTLSAQGIYDFQVKDKSGTDVPLAQFKGKVLLIVNTATRCGFTRQYSELEALYEKYHDEGLEILDFPCNQFGQQAPGTVEEIQQFCTLNYGVRFPQLYAGRTGEAASTKIEVNGDNTHPLYAYLKSQQGFGGFRTDSDMGKAMDTMLRRQDSAYDKNPDIKWNFTKFLIARDGRVVRRYEPTDDMSDVEVGIGTELNPVLSNIMARRSVRRYLDKPVEHEKLQTLAMCGINAPSGMNRQPWIVRVVEDRKLIADVTEVYRQANAEQVARDSNFKNMFRNAPNIICVCTPANGGGELDAGLLGENIMLAAQAMGLGTCCLGGPVRFLLANEKARFFIDKLEIPADYKLNYIIAVGYPDEQPQAKPRDASRVKFIK